MYKGTHIRLSADFSVEIFQAQRDGMYLKWIERKKNLFQEYSSQQGYHSELKER